MLFLCTGASCRSQIAAGWARAVFGGRVEAHAAGAEPKGLNERAVRVMAEAGVDISGQASRHVDAFRGERFDLVVTVCDAAREACPVWVGEAGRVVHRGFDDPPRLAVGARSEEEALGHFRRVRDEIRGFVEGELMGLLDGAAA
ncbi:MAG: arsenate reductase ArsC, partial [Planctomycetota bacterium]|nr:arsenate reductase ArsC [Planctomycetota bacterium]